MGFRTGAYATVWEVSDDGKYVKARVSISRKNKTTDQYETDFSGYLNFFGECAHVAAELESGARIKLGDVDVSNRYDPEKKREFITYKVFSFEEVESKAAPKAAEAPAKKKSTAAKKGKKATGLEDGDTDVEGDDDDCPF